MAIYQLVKRKLKKYLTVFVGGRFAVFNLFFPTSKPEVVEKLRIPRCPLRKPMLQIGVGIFEISHLVFELRARKIGTDRQTDRQTDRNTYIQTER